MKTRTIPRIFIGLAVFLAQLVGTAALAQDSYDYRRDVNFAGIRTFAFKATPPMDPVASKTTTYDSPLVRERTNAAIAAQLESRGMRHVTENPDVYIVSRRSFEVETSYYGPYGYGWGPYAGVGYGPYYGGWGGWGGWDMYSWLEGTLTVDMEDARTGDLRASPRWTFLFKFVVRASVACGLLATATERRCLLASRCRQRCHGCPKCNRT